MGFFDKIFRKSKQTSDVKIFDRLYPYQKDAVTSAIDKEKGIVCLPTGTGKSFIQSAIIADDIIKNGDFKMYVVNAPRIILTYQLLKEVYGFLVDAKIEAIGELQAGSRIRQLSLESDNVGFYEWVLKQQNLLNYLTENPTHRLFGEWLVPHSLKTYRQDAWRKFYVFEVVEDRLQEELTHDADEKFNYLHYNDYKPLLEKHEIDFIPPIAVIRNSNYEQLVNQLMKNDYLIEDGKGYGEGIVLKNYDFKNKFGRKTWAKIVTSEFKEKHAKVMGKSTVEGKKMVEEEIAEKYVTSAFCEKEYAKIETTDGWSSKMIPRLLNVIFYEIVKEESWNFVKENRNPTINFKTLQHFVFAKVRDRLPNVF